MLLQMIHSRQLQLCSSFYWLPFPYDNIKKHLHSNVFPFVTLFNSYHLLLFSVSVLSDYQLAAITLNVIGQTKQFLFSVHLVDFTAVQKFDNI